MFVYNKTRDYLRFVSKHVSIGAVYQTKGSGAKAKVTLWITTLYFVDRTKLEALGEVILIFTSSLLVAWLFLSSNFGILPQTVQPFKTASLICFSSDSTNCSVVELTKSEPFGCLEWLRTCSPRRALYFVSQLYHPVGFDLGQMQATPGPTYGVFPITQWLGVPGFITFTFSSHSHSPCLFQLLCAALRAPLLLAIALSSLTILNPFVIQEVYQGRPTQVYLLFHGLF